MQIIQNSKFIIIKLLKSKLVQIPSLLILKHRIITKVQKNHNLISLFQII